MRFLLTLVDMLTNSFVTVAFAARTQLGDPAFIHSGKKLREMTTKGYGAEVRANITDVSSSPCTLPLC